MSARRVADLEGRDAYDLLGVAASATRAEIRRGYRRAMLLAHPDRGGPEDQAKLINCALELLMQDRANYDEYRRRLARRAAQDPTAQNPTARERAGRRWRAGQDTEPPSGWDEDWPDDDEADRDDGDPWAAADEGVGAPGRGADAPGAAERPDLGEELGDEEADDRLYRPFAPGTRRAEPWSLGRLINTPMVLGAVMLLLVVIGAIVNAGNDSGSPYVGNGSPALPTIGRTYSYPGLPQASYPYPTGYLYPVPSYTRPSLLDSYLSATDPTHPLALSLFGASRHTCDLKSAGRLRCSGTNSDGQLGVGDRRAHSGSRPLAGGHTWRAVTEGRHHTCAIRQDRSLWCWGANELGQLGSGKGKQDRSVPGRVSGGGRWRSVAANGDLTCAVRTTGTLWCWGTPLLKAPDPPASRVPKRYGKAITWTKVRAGRSGLCAERPRHRDTCWI